MIDMQKLKALAENYRNLNGDDWYAEESKALDSIPCFSAEAFIAAARPAVVLEMIAEIEEFEKSRARAIVLIDQLEAQQAEIKLALVPLEQDAQRYRHIAERLQVSGGPYGVSWPSDYTTSSRAEVDAAIDAAMAKGVSHG